LLGILLAATPSQAYSPESLPQQPESGLRLKEPVSAGKNQSLVTVEYWSESGGRVQEILGELVLPDGPWKFSKAERFSGSGYRVAARQKKEEYTTDDGVKSRRTIIVLTVSNGNSGVSPGSIAQLRFALSPSGSAAPLPLSLRGFRSLPLGTPPAEPPVLEPPQMGPEMNPVPTCFFFTH
jgi:hypothetical protein